MSVRESDPSNRAGECGTGAVSTAIPWAENGDVTELVSPPAGARGRDALEQVRRNLDGTTCRTSTSHRTEVEVRGNGVDTVTEPSGGT